MTTSIAVLRLMAFTKSKASLANFRPRRSSEVIAWQLAEAMQDRKLTKSALAVLMKTRRTQISRVLDSSDGNVTIETLQREVALVGRRVQSELI